MLPEKETWRRVLRNKRRVGLSASQFGAALGFNGRVADFIDYQRNIVGTKLEFSGNVATAHGVRTEPLARTVYELLFQVRCDDGGFFIDGAARARLACSPDGIVVWRYVTPDAVPPTTVSACVTPAKSLTPSSSRNGHALQNSASMNSGLTTNGLMVVDPATQHNGPGSTPITLSNPMLARPLMSPPLSVLRSPTEPTASGRKTDHESGLPGPTATSAVKHKRLRNEDRRVGGHERERRAFERVLLLTDSDDGEPCEHPSGHLTACDIAVSLAGGSRDIPIEIESSDAGLTPPMRRDRSADLPTRDADEDDEDDGVPVAVELNPRLLSTPTPLHVNPQLSPAHTSSRHSSFHSRVQWPSPQPSQKKLHRVPHRLLEIKSPFKALYHGGREANQPFGIPLTYMCQMQGQMAISGATECDFFVFLRFPHIAVTCWRVLYHAEFWEHYAKPKLLQACDWIAAEDDPVGTSALPRSFAFEPFDFSKIQVLPLMGPTTLRDGQPLPRDVAMYPWWAALSEPVPRPPGFWSGGSASVAPGDGSLLLKRIALDHAAEGDTVLVRRRDHPSDSFVAVVVQLLTVKPQQAQQHEETDADGEQEPEESQAFTSNHIPLNSQGGFDVAPAPTPRRPDDDMQERPVWEAIVVVTCGTTSHLYDSPPILGSSAAFAEPTLSAASSRRMNVPSTKEAESQDCFPAPRVLPETQADCHAWPVQWEVVLHPLQDWDITVVAKRGTTSSEYKSGVVSTSDIVDIVSVDHPHASGCSVVTKAAAPSDVPALRTTLSEKASWSVVDADVACPGGALVPCHFVRRLTGGAGSQSRSNTADTDVNAAATVVDTDSTPVPLCDSRAVRRHHDLWVWPLSAVRAITAGSASTLYRCTATPVPVAAKSDPNAMKLNLAVHRCALLTASPGEASDEVMNTDAALQSTGSSKVLFGRETPATLVVIAAEDIDTVARAVTERLLPPIRASQRAARGGHVSPVATSGAQSPGFASPTFGSPGFGMLPALLEKSPSFDAPLPPAQPAASAPPVRSLSTGFQRRQPTVTRFGQKPKVDTSTAETSDAPPGSSAVASNVPSPVPVPPQLQPQSAQAAPSTTSAQRETFIAAAVLSAAAWVCIGAAPPPCSSVQAIETAWAAGKKRRETITSMQASMSAARPSAAANDDDTGQQIPVTTEDEAQPPQRSATDVAVPDSPFGGHNPMPRPATVWVHCDSAFTSLFATPTE